MLKFKRMSSNLNLPLLNISLRRQV